MEPARSNVEHLATRPNSGEVGSLVNIEKHDRTGYSLTNNESDLEKVQKANIKYNALCDLFVERSIVNKQDCKVQQIDGKVTLVAYPTSALASLCMFWKMRGLGKIEKITNPN